MSGWGAVTWDIARAGGFTAYGLLALSVAVGLALTLHWQSARWPRMINSELHNFLTLLALVFTGVHVLAVWLDPFTRFGWREVFIPFVSHYRPLWMALGIVALYLGLAIGLSTWLRPWIGYAWWRRLHVLTLVLFGLVTAHGLATGSDTRTWWGVLIYGVSVLLVGTLLVERLMVPSSRQGRAHPVIAALTGVVALAGVALTVVGPMQPGWNAFANNGQGSGQRGTTVQSSLAQRTHSRQQGQQGNTASTQDPFAQAFTASAQGTMTQQGPDASGAVTLDVRATLSGQTQGVLHIQMQGQESSFDDGIAIDTTAVTLGTTASNPLYQGPLTQFSGERRWRMAAMLAPAGTGAASQQIQVQIVLAVGPDGNVSGVVQGAPASSGSGGGGNGGGTLSGETE